MSVVCTDVTLSSDFITGFCGETEEEHQDTISLMEAVQFDMAYMFAYSMRKVRYFNLEVMIENMTNIKIISECTCNLHPACFYL